MNVMSQLVAVSALVLSVSTSAHAQFMGREFSAQYRFPDIATEYSFGSAAPPTFLVGAGVETVFAVEGVTWITADFTNATLRLSFATVLSNPSWNSTTFNGMVFTRESGAPLTITSAAIDGSSTCAGLTADRVSYSGDQVAVNMAGLQYSDGTELLINFEGGGVDVPEPATSSMVLAGLLLLGVAARRRRQHMV